MDKSNMSLEKTDSSRSQLKLTAVSQYDIFRY